MNRRRDLLKTVLWGVLGVLAAVTLARFGRGLGATTALSDATPWGLWIAFDVMAGVALAAGGFVLAATVYVFHLERFRPFVRPAVLTAFLGYAAVATGLLYDLGLPWHIWHPFVHPQPHSVLFEVALCVGLYLTVLALEFSPVVLEHPRLAATPLQRLHRVLKRATIPLVITGVVLSTLHQSSLGSLFLIAPHRLHPLWYSPNIWLLFFVSAVGLGLMMVTLESFFSAWLFGHRLRLDLLSGLGKAASAALFLYAGIRLADLALRGQLGALFDGSWQSGLFAFELLLSALAPATLLAIPWLRRRAGGLLAASLMTVLGMLGYRFDVCVVAFSRPAELPYFPAWTELAVSVGIVAGALLIFTFFVERLRVYDEARDEGGGADAAGTGKAPELHGLRPLLPRSLSAPRRFTMAGVLGFTLAVTLLPTEALHGARPQPVPAQGVRLIEAEGEAQAPLMVIDGNRDGRLVQFAHDAHATRLESQGGCAACHHRNLPYKRTSACASCHRDMYSPTDTFEHAAHVAHLGGNAGCARCHRDATLAKTRASATPCVDCHADMGGVGLLVRPTASGSGFAAGYRDAMHGLCVPCHQAAAAQEPTRLGEEHARCDRCHGDQDEALIRQRAPYVSTRDAAGSVSEGAGALGG